MSITFYMDDSGNFRAYCLSCNEITLWSEDARTNQWRCECGSRESDEQATVAYTDQLIKQSLKLLGHHNGITKKKYE